MSNSGNWAASKSGIEHRTSGRRQADRLSAQPMAFFIMLDRSLNILKRCKDRLVLIHDRLGRFLRQDSRELLCNLC